MNADAELDAALGRHAGVALDEAGLHLDGAAHGVDHAAELDEASVAGSLDDTPVMRVDRGIDQIAAQPPEARQRSVLVRACEPAVPDDIRDQNRRELSRFAHGAASLIARRGFRPPPARPPNRVSRNSPTGKSLFGLGMAAHPCCTRRTWKQEVQVLRVGSRSLSTPRSSISPSMREE